MKKTVSIVLALLMLTGMRVSAVDSANTDNSQTILSYNSSSDSYEEYLDKSGIARDGEDTVEINADDCEVFSAQEYETGVLLEENGAKIVFNVTTNEGFYNLKLFYRHFGESSSNIKVGLKIDGNYPFEDCRNLSLERFWTDKTNDAQTDKYGNEFSPEQVAADEFLPAYFKDETGVVTQPYKFALGNGAHRIEIELSEGKFEIKKLLVSAPETADSYKGIMSLYEEKGYKWYSGEAVTFQGESAKYKSSKSIIAKSDNQTANITPSNPYKNVLNYIGGDNWSTPGSSVIWEIEAPKDAIYKIDFKYQQRGVINGVTYRTLVIDGKVPFAEAEAISFPYTTGWSNKTLQDTNGNAFGVYLSKGKHTVELSCTLGPAAELYKKLEKIVSNIGDRYLQIIMITGESPDINRDYELFKQIPDFNKSLKQDRDELYKLAEYSEGLSGANGNQAAASFRNMARVLNNMIENKYTAHKYVSDYYTNYNTISAWLSDLRSMPLSIDSIVFCAEDYDVQEGAVGLFGKMAFTLKRFFVSFLDEYSMENGEKTDLRLWVNWGRDQAQVLNSLIDNKFTPNTGIKVKLEIVSTSVINGILSGNAPDLVLHSTRSSPVNMAMRGALVELSDLDGFDTAIKRFQKTAAVPYYYNGGCYAIPDTQSFMVMFYRKDVLDKLELEVPETWEDFTRATTKILRNNMQVYMPYLRLNGTTVADAGVGSLSLFPSFLIQNGVDIYNADLNKCNLASSKSISVFADWTEYYTEYKLMKEANFYNRFRLGTMPLGISTYTLYTQILTAAPEIENKWGIAMLPGTKSDDGTVNHSVSGAGTGASILKVSKHQNEAWEFIKWWTDEETQFLYSENLECVLGPTGRQAVSNVEAFKNMAWSKQDKEVLLNQWENVVEIPEVPGSYYLSRSIDQAYWEVMNGKSTPKEALIKWADIANAEIDRKIKEYS